MKNINNVSEINTLLDSSNEFLERKVWQYLLNFVTKTDPKSPAAYSFCAACEDLFEDQIPGFAVKKIIKDVKDVTITYEKTPLPQRNAVKSKDWKALEKYFRAKRDSLPEIDQPPVLKNILKLGDLLGFSQEEKNIVTFIYIARSGPHIARLVLDTLKAANAQDLSALGAFIARVDDNEKNFKKYTQALLRTGKFYKYGIITDTSYHAIPTIDIELEFLLTTPNLTNEQIIELVVGKPAKTDLSYDDFVHIGPQLEIVRDILQNAAKTHAAGINILFFGPAGVGKTQLAIALSKEIGVNLYAIGEEDDIGSVGDAPQFDDDNNYMGSVPSSQQSDSSGRQRLAQILKAQSLLADKPDTVLLFDEIEDLLLKGTDSDKKADTESKILINRLLEKNPVPTIWCGNDPEKFHIAVRDRFTISVYIDEPPVNIRRKIWKRQAELQQVTLTDQQIAELARSYDPSPRKIANAVRAAKYSNQGAGAIEPSLLASTKITLGTGEALYDHCAVSAMYNPAFSNPKTQDGTEYKLDTLLEKGKKSIPFALFAQGEAGTGLKSLPRYISEQLNMVPHECSMRILSIRSDRSNPEHNIAEVFNTAADLRRFLIINDLEYVTERPDKPSAYDDDLVGFFVENARRYRLPFAATSSKLDKAPNNLLLSMFSDLVQLNKMNEDQKHQAFQEFFKIKSDEELEAIQELVISDFADVKKRLQKLQPAEKTLKKIYEMLEEQVEIRGYLNKHIGFQKHKSDAETLSVVREQQQSGIAAALN